MKKEEILKRAQNKKRNKLDEMEVDILLRSNHVGLIVGLLFCLIFMVLEACLNHPYQDIYSVLCSILCGQYLYKGVRLKNKSMLGIGVIWGISALLLLIAYFL